LRNARTAGNPAPPIGRPRTLPPTRRAPGATPGVRRAPTRHPRR
jgi:hypothetical protein